ncbi:MAG TPA: DUF2975 domain-containing protein [Candidatus Pygmaiobacter gallistercoris]|nr:DUF2975 domain-containing protein [Candidatus Pygmaiobacter gallistercoris]
MWNKDKSLLLSRIAVGIFMAVALFWIVAAPTLTKLFLDFSRSPMQGMSRQQTLLCFLATQYLSLPVAGTLLWNLHRLLQRIGRSEVFVRANERALRRISWCCLIEAAICVLSCLYYLPFLFVAIAAGFMALIVRVIKNVFAEAIALKDENDFTI